MLETLTGKNKAFIARVAKQQYEKYGNKDVFSGYIDANYNSIELCFGENSIEFYFKKNGEINCTLGIAQGHKYHKNLESCAKELYNKYLKEEY
jgi:hypothetical protein